MTKYLIRLDDACPEMDKIKWNQVFNILEKYQISPLVGIIPHNEDPHTRINNADNEFWNKMRIFQDKGWSFALHGFNHCCNMNSGGINPVHQYSEFASLSYEDQSAKIKEGYSILTSNGIYPDFFFAPCHTYDFDTIKALRELTPIKYISDTFALKPYNEDGITFIPQQMGKFRNVSITGYWTFCFHPNEMTKDEIITFENFIKRNRNKFINFSDLIMTNWGHVTILDRLLRKIYFLRRDINKIINRGK